MRKPSPSRRPVRLAFLSVSVVSVVLGAWFGCGPYDTIMAWVCLNPKTGHLDPTIGDPNHYVNGTFDPCHCYDPCGPTLECPIDVDAGKPQPGCDGGGGTGGGMASDGG